MRSALLHNAFAALIAATLLVGTPVAAEAAAPDAQLSITLKNTVRTVRPGDHVAYTAQVRNLGDADANVKIVLDAPSYVRLADSKGATVVKSQATWATTVSIGKTTSFTIKATIDKIPNAERRVTTLASAYVGDGPAPVVRTANASFIAGIADTPGGKATSTPTASSGDSQVPVLGWIIAGGVVLIIVIATIVLLAFRRHRPRRAQRRTTYGT